MWIKKILCLCFVFILFSGTISFAVEKINLGVKGIERQLELYQERKGIDFDIEAKSWGNYEERRKGRQNFILDQYYLNKQLYIIIWQIKYFVIDSKKPKQFGDGESKFLILLFDKNKGRIVDAQSITGDVSEEVYEGYLYSYEEQGLVEKYSINKKEEGIHISIWYLVSGTGGIQGVGDIFFTYKKRNLKKIFVLNKSFAGGTTLFNYNCFTGDTDDEGNLRIVVREEFYKYTYDDDEYIPPKYGYKISTDIYKKIEVSNFYEIYKYNGKKYILWKKTKKIKSKLKKFKQPEKWVQTINEFKKRLKKSH